MTKILLIPGLYHKLNWDSYQGGLESFSVQTWKFLNRLENVDCTILAPADTNLEPVPYPIIKWNSDSRETFLLSKLSTNEIDRKMQIIEKTKFDYIINSSDHEIPTKFHEKLIKTGIPYLPVVHIHPKGFARYGFWKKLFKFKKEHPHIRIAVVSEYLKRKVFEHFGYDADYVIPLTFDEGLGKANFVESPLSEVAYVGRITQLKNSHHLIDWLKDSSYNLHIMGDRWSNVASIRTRELTWQQTPFPKNVIHEGQLTQNELRHRLKNKLCLISPLPTETFSLTAFGAQKLGVPVVSVQKEPNEAINEYMIEGTTGFTVLLQPKERLQNIGPRVIEAIEKCKGLDRKFIFEYFDKKYSSERYVSNIYKKLRMCEKSSNDLTGVWA